jgi:hypothetical protein
MAMSGADWLPEKSYSYVAACVIAAALLFDVGYFTAAGPPYFYLFSATEHLLIAFPALTDLTMVGIVLFIFYSFALGIVDRLARRRGAKTPAGWQHLKRATAVLTGCILAGASIFALMQPTKQWGLFSWAVGSALVWLGALAGPRAYLPQLRWIGILLIISYSAYGFGYYEAYGPLSPTQCIGLIHSKSTSSEKEVQWISARILAAGSHGVLFMLPDDPRRHAVFSKWDNIRAIANSSDPWANLGCASLTQSETGIQN